MEETKWYNLEDRENYDFATYLIITETQEDRNFNMIDDYEEAITYKNKCENDKKYIYVSQIKKINTKTNNLLCGIEF